jgi:hypothetical protein
VVTVEHVRPDPPALRGYRMDGLPHSLEALVPHGDILSGGLARREEAAGVPGQAVAACDENCRLIRNRP